MLHCQDVNENRSMARVAFGNLQAKLIQASPTLAKTNRNLHTMEVLKCNAEVDSKLRR